MSHFCKILVACAAALVLSTAARAGTYELTFTGEGVSGDVFATTSGSGSTQTVTGISGWVTDAEVGPGTFVITGLVGYAAATNLFYTTSPFVDFGGLSFTTVSGGEFNLGLGGSGATGQVLNVSVIDPVGYVGVPGSTDLVMTATTVPEPANLALMTAGLLGLIGMTRRRGAR